MPRYNYEIIDKKGRKKKDTITADSLVEARNIIKSTGKTIIKMEEANILNSGFRIPKKVTAKDLAIFCQQMKSMLASGVTAVDALTMTASSTSNKTLKDALEIAAQDISKGESMAASFSKHPKIFPFILIRMVEAGEESGSIEQVFSRMEVQFEKSAHIKNVIKKSTSYPKMLLVVCIIVLIVMCTYVLPMFLEVFNEMGSDLPAPTKAMLALSDFIKSYWMICIIIIAVVFVAWKVFSSSDKGKFTIDGIKMKIPLFSNLETKTATANLARVLSTLLSSGMYIVQALEIASNTMTNVHFKNALDNVKIDVMNGIPLTDAINDADMFPPLFINLLGIGERTGNLTEMLDKAAKYFEDEVDTATEQLTGALQPVIIIIMAGLVGLMVYSIYGPMMNIYDGIQ